MLRGTAFVVRGGLRIKVFKALVIERNPSALSKRFNRDSSTISEVLAHLQQAKLITRTTEKNKRGTFYLHNRNGRAVFKELQKLGL